MFKYISGFYSGSWGVNLFRAAVVLSGVVLLMLAQFFPYVYDKQLSANKAKIKIEIAYAEIEDKFYKENSIGEGHTFRRLDTEYSRKNLDDIPCWNMGALEAECEIAQYEFKFYLEAIGYFDRWTFFLGLIAAIFYSLSVVLLIDWPILKKLFRDSYSNLFAKH